MNVDNLELDPAKRKKMMDLILEIERDNVRSREYRENQMINKICKIIEDEVSRGF